MEYEIINTKPVFLVMTNTDLTEGRGAEYPLYCCWTKRTAIRLGKGRYVQGTDCHIAEETAFQIKVTKGEDTYNSWYVPNRMIAPSKEDILADDEENRKLDILFKMRNAGITDEEIDLVTGKK